MNLERKQKKGRRNQSGQRQRHKAVSAGCQFWFKPAPSKARSFASVLARVVPTPALAPLDKKHQRSSGCGLPYHLKQRQLGYWTLLGAICFYLATKSWKPTKKRERATMGGVVFERKQAQNTSNLQCFMQLESLACWWNTFLFILAAQKSKRLSMIFTKLARASKQHKTKTCNLYTPSPE